MKAGKHVAWLGDVSFKVSVTEGKKARPLPEVLPWSEEYNPGSNRAQSRSAAASVSNLWRIRLLSLRVFLLFSFQTSSWITKINGIWRGKICSCLTAASPAPATPVDRLSAYPYKNGVKRNQGKKSQTKAGLKTCLWAMQLPISKVSWKSTVHKTSLLRVNCTQHDDEPPKALWNAEMERFSDCLVNC